MNTTAGEYKGVVKFFQTAKGFGFIYPEAEMSKEDEDSRDNVFFHCSDIVTPGEGNGGTHSYAVLHTGDMVTFDVATRDTKDGPRNVAINVNLVSRAKVQRQTALAPNNITVGVKKSHVPLLRSIITDVLAAAESGSTEVSASEAEALLAFRTQLDHAEAKMQAQREHVHAPTVAAAAPAANGENAKKKGKRSAEATA